MSEFIIKIEDDIVQSLGKQNIEQYLQIFVTQTILKVAASDVLKDYESDNISMDENWINSKKNAFLNDRYSQYIKVYANV
ncbi:MAG: hypothetical protein IPO21_03515 [Bacteroidales bacterium]|nr:hypothetical protein [Bacteroidales bacterium]